MVNSLSQLSWKTLELTWNLVCLVVILSKLRCNFSVLNCLIKPHRVEKHTDPTEMYWTLHILLTSNILYSWVQKFTAAENREKVKEKRRSEGTMTSDRFVKKNGQRQTRQHGRVRIRRILNSMRESKRCWSYKKSCMSMSEYISYEEIYQTGICKILKCYICESRINDISYLYIVQGIYRLVYCYVRWHGGIQYLTASGCLL